MILRWSGNSTKVLCLVNAKERLESDEYLGILLGLFEDVTLGEGNFELKRICDCNVGEYAVKDLVNKLEQVYELT